MKLNINNEKNDLTENRIEKKEEESKINEIKNDIIEEEEKKEEN